MALIVAVVAALAFLISDRRETLRASAYDHVRRTADTVTAPVGKVLSAPVRWIGGAGTSVGNYFDAANENRRLKVQLSTDDRWRDEALRLREENARYRALMGVKTDPPIQTVFARTLTDARGPFSNTRLADAGSSKGVIEGNPVLAEHGLVGRVTGVAPDVSRIMMLTDTESRTPVMVARTNARAILTGDGGPTPKLAYLRSHDPIAEGDRVATSGDGGVYPRGLPVGVVVKDLDGGWRVALDSDASPIDYVQILLFRDFSQLISKSALEPKILPSAMTEEPRKPLAGAVPTPGAAATAAGPKPAASAGAAPAKPGSATAAASGPSATPKSAKPLSATAKPATPKPATPKAAAAGATAKPGAGAHTTGPTANLHSAKPHNPATSTKPATDSLHRPAPRPAATDTGKPEPAKPVKPEHEQQEAAPF